MSNDNARDEIIYSTHIKKLNDEFYNNFNSKYFTQKISYLLVLLSDTDYLSKKYAEGIEIGELKASGKHLTDDEKEHIEQIIKNEISLTYYHAIETFFRLFIAHTYSTDCPWVEISNLTSYVSFKKQIKKIAEQKAPFDTDNIGEIIAGVMFGGHPPKETTISEEKWSKNIINLKDWIYQFANDLLSDLDYNAFKHGLSIFSTQLGFELQGTPLKKEKSDAFTFITKKKEEDGDTYFYKTFKFINWEEKFALTMKITEMIDNVVKVGRFRYLKDTKGAKLRLFDDININDIFKEGIHTSEMSMSLPFKTSKK